MRTSTAVARKVRVTGVVQGVGFRPFVVRLASELGVSGRVGNDTTSVFVEVEGPEQRVAEFLARLESDAPPLARVESVVSQQAHPTGVTGFSIVESAHVIGRRTLVPPDTALCSDCARELNDPHDRRYRHPFITCTNCGPRYTIIRDLPYDRPATTMATFSMCHACREEYEDPTNRRFHAQPVSCHDCGPTVWIQRGTDVVACGDEAIAGAIQALVDGQIVAVKGVGGFHLACDAANSAAVHRLRLLKSRPDKPFALMVSDVESALTLIEPDDNVADTLSDPAHPIVLGRRRPTAPVCTEVARDLDELGVMVAYTPLHALLFSAVPGSGVQPPEVLVMTSGNLADEPLSFTNDEALRRLSHIADVFVMHDRDIAVPCEDSVVTVWSGREVPIRRSRGYAPLPVPLPGDAGPSVLATGGEIKNVVCVTRGDSAFLSGHLGDVGSLESQAAWHRSVNQLVALNDVAVEAVACDAHPGYLTSAWAQERAEQYDVPLIKVQHHHAHLASLLVEHHVTDQSVVGVVFDGTGYGCDRTVWGGELLRVDGSLAVADRVGHLAAFDLPGGDTAVRNPFRSALALLAEAGLDAQGLELESVVPADERAAVWSMLRTGTGCVRTTSAGRLFDAVASLIGVRQRIGYEAQAAIELEQLARRASGSVALPIPVVDGVIDHIAMIPSLVAAVRDGAPADQLALGFHEGLAAAVSEAVDLYDTETVGLSGGVFANRLLSTLISSSLERAGHRVLQHRTVPPNDGGLSLGQAAVARCILMSSQGGD